MVSLCFVEGRLLSLKPSSFSQCISHNITLGFDNEAHYSSKPYSTVSWKKYQYSERITENDSVHQVCTHKVTKLVPSHDNPNSNTQPTNLTQRVKPSLRTECMYNMNKFSVISIPQRCLIIKKFYVCLNSFSGQTWFCFCTQSLHHVHCKKIALYQIDLTTQHHSNGKGNIVLIQKCKSNHCKMYFFALL